MRSIRWTRQALEDIEAIHDFIARDSTRDADHFIEGIIPSVDRLGDFPRSGRVVPEIGEDTLREVSTAVTVPSKGSEGTPRSLDGGPLCETLAASAVKLRDQIRDT